MRLVAVKRVRYPRGPNAREYKPGEEFDTLTDRDAKALTLVGAAKRADVMPAEPPAPRPQVVNRSLAPEEPATEPENYPAEEDRPRRGRYKRRDLTAEE